MMRRFVVVLAVCSFVLASATGAYALSSTELITNDKLYDGKTVTYSGEVVGDIMRRGDFAWINVNDGENAVGIWLPFALTSDIQTLGNYKNIGDRVQVTGVFYQADRERGGETDIHAQGLVVLEKGHPRDNRVKPIRVVEALVLSIAALALYLVGRWLKSRDT